MKDDKEIFMNDNEEEVINCNELKQKMILEDNMATAKRVQNNSEQEGKDERAVVVKMKIQQLRVEGNQQS